MGTRYITCQHMDSILTLESSFMKQKRRYLHLGNGQNNCIMFDLHSCGCYTLFGSCQVCLSSLHCPARNQGSYLKVAIPLTADGNIRKQLFLLTEAGNIGKQLSFLSIVYGSCMVLTGLLCTSFRLINIYLGIFLILFLDEKKDTEVTINFRK